MLRAAEASGLVLHADLEPRYLPAVAAMRDLFGAEGVLGQLQSIRLDHEMDLEASYRLRSMVFGLGPWYVDLLDALATSPAEAVELIPEKVRPDGLVVSGQALIRYESGTDATWSFGFEGPRRLAMDLSATGDKGEARADLTTGALSWRQTAGEWSCDVVDCSRPEAGFIGMRESIHAFIGAVQGQGESQSGPDVILRVQPILVELRRLEAALSR